MNTLTPEIPVNTGPERQQGPEVVVLADFRKDRQQALDPVRTTRETTERSLRLLRQEVTASGTETGAITPPPLETSLTAPSTTEQPAGIAKVFSFVTGALRMENPQATLRHRAARVAQARRAANTPNIIA